MWYPANTGFNHGTECSAGSTQGSKASEAELAARFAGRNTKGGPWVM
jgi:hypothetical protein